MCISCTSNNLLVINFRVYNFHGCINPQKFFDDKRFSIYGSNWFNTGNTISQTVDHCYICNQPGHFAGTALWKAKEPHQNLEEGLSLMEKQLLQLFIKNQCHHHFLTLKLQSEALAKVSTTNHTLCKGGGGIVPSWSSPNQGCSWISRWR